MYNCKERSHFNVLRRIFNTNKICIVFVLSLKTVSLLRCLSRNSNRSEIDFEPVFMHQNVLKF